MHIRRMVFFAAVVILFVAGLPEQPASAQPGGANVCSSLVQTAISALGSNCEGLGRNSACYGTFRVNATFSDPAAMASFSVPADQAPIDTLQSIRTFPLDTVEQEWGIAVINAQANIPGALPGQSAVFLLIGDAEIENAVAPESAFLPDEPVPLTTETATSLRQQPDSAAPIEAEIPAGTELLVDAISEDGAWLRTAYNDLGGWVAREAVAVDADVSNLAVYTTEQFTPMQAFYFRSGITSECAEAPNAVLVQGPENLTIDINANGADIRLGSTIMLQTLSSDDETDALSKQDDGANGDTGSQFRLTVLDGEAILDPNSNDPVVIPEGQTVVSCLSEAQNLGSDGEANDQVVEDCNQPRPLTEEEWNQFAFVNGLTLNYPIDITEHVETTPEVEATGTTAATATRTTASTCQPNAGWGFTYMVRPGDTLSQIAALAGVSTQALAQGNCITNVNLIYAGSVLRVPSPVIQPTQVPPTPIPPTPEPPTSVPPTSVPPTAVPPTSVPPTPEPPTATLTFTPTLEPTATNTPEPEADLQIATSVDPTTASAYDIVTYTVVVLNNGPLDATGIAISDLIPDQFEYSESPFPETGTYDFQTDTWTIDSLLSGEAATIEINAFIPGDTPPGAVSSAVYISASDQPDSNTADNIASATVIVVEGSPEL